jgi:hypothetical protein
MEGVLGGARTTQKNFEKNLPFLEKRQAGGFPPIEGFVYYSTV